VTADFYILHFLDKHNESNIGKWLKSFFGLVFLDPSDVEDCFGDDIMRVLPL
jgi:hypothetical protein